jgi:hypothetical protein
LWLSGSGSFETRRRWRAAQTRLGRWPECRNAASLKEIPMSTLDADQRDHLPKGDFALPKERKLPLEDAAHVRNAIARFNQVKGVSDEERDAAWKRIEAAARKFGVEVEEKSWREIGKK